MSLSRVISQYIDNFEEQLYTSMPGVVENWYPDTCTIDVYPSMVKIQEDGTRIKEGLLENIPVQFPCVGDAAITFKLNKGDKVALHFSQDNHINFFTSPEDIVEPKTKRKHNVNNAFATIGFRKFSDSPVKIEDALNIYYKDSRVTINGDSSLEIEVKNDSGVDSNIDIKTDGEISITNNQQSSSLILKANGDIEGVTASKFSMDNGTVELVSLISELINTLANTTVNTIYGVSILNSKPQLTALKNQLDSMKA